MAAYVSRLQAVATRSAEVVRSRLVPTVKSSYTELMAKNAGARARSSARRARTRARTRARAHVGRRR
jgi:hypothetical protein